MREIGLKYLPDSLGTRVECLANLIYLAQHSEADLNRQRHYLDCAATMLLGMSDHPALVD